MPACTNYREPVLGEKNLLLIPQGKVEFIEDDIITMSGDRVSLEDNNSINLFDGKNSFPIIDIFSKYDGKISSIAVSPREAYLAVGGRIECDEIDANTISLYSYYMYTYYSSAPNKSILIKDLVSHDGRVNDLSFSSYGRYLASASADKSVKIWGMEEFDLKQTINFHKGEVYGVKMIKEGLIYKIISIGYDGQIALHVFDEDTNTVTLLKSHQLPYGLKYISYEKNKNEIAVCGEAKEVVIYDLNLKHIKTIKTPMVPHRLRYDREGKFLMVGGGRYSSQIKNYRTSDYSSDY